MCRAYLGEFYHPETKEMVVTGRNNIGAVSVNIPKLAIESGKDRDKFFELLDKCIDMVWSIHDDSWEKIAQSKGSTNPLLFCEGGSWMSVGYDEEIRPIVKASTASIGYVGLNEASEYLFGEPITKHQDFGLEVVQYLRDSVDREKGNREYLPAIYSTPAEGLAYKWQMKNREQYGLIDNVTDNDYMTNSFHVHVKEDISPIEKAEFEAPFHAIATGGRISYAEFPNGVSFDVLKDCVDHAMKQGLYYGVNVVSSSCNHCAHQGDFLDTCPKCHSEDITTVTRVCGYLSYSKVKGDTRYNPGKKAEILDRVKHVKENREWF